MIVLRRILRDLRAPFKWRRFEARPSRRRAGPAAVRPEKRTRPPGALLALGLVTVSVVSCQRSVPGPYVPEVAGIVVSSEWTEPNVVARYNLDNGTSFSLNVLEKTKTTRVGGESSAVGDLLLAGSGPDPWLAFLAPAAESDLPADCYAVYGYATDEGDWIQTDIGLRLRKAPGFDPGILPDTPDGPVPPPRPGLRYEGPGQVFCVNREGLVTARRPSF